MKQYVLAAVAACALLAACAPQQPAPLTGAALIERGDYLVNGVVLCGDCHTPRGEGGALDETRKLQGADIGPGPPGFASIAPSLAGLPAGYTEEQFIAFLQTGVRPDGTATRPPMPPYRLNEEDARAVAAYIATLPQAQ
ncbi:MAG: c-type cytochrome [Hyphomonadaceae bacterium]|nr:c-type cytochrome [Hyphomonadaceae bacterium]